MSEACTRVPRGIACFYYIRVSFWIKRCENASVGATSTASTKPCVGTTPRSAEGHAVVEGWRPGSEPRPLLRAGWCSRARAPFSHMCGPVDISSSAPTSARPAPPPAQQPTPCVWGKGARASPDARSYRDPPSAPPATLPPPLTPSPFRHSWRETLWTNWTTWPRSMSSTPSRATSQLPKWRSPCPAGKSTSATLSL